MKLLFGSFFLFFFPIISFCQKEQPEAIAETMSSTFNFYGDRQTGTCFMVERNGKQYFVTAAHLFQPSHKSGDLAPIQIVIENTLREFNASVYFHSNRNIDVAVFTLPVKVIQNLTFPEGNAIYKEEYQKLFPSNGVSTDSMVTLPAMEVFFFGFPLRSLGTEFLGIKFPLVKRAIISGWLKHKETELLLLDGHNNVGFSGGPIAAYNNVTKKMSLVGIISGYIPEPINVKHKKQTLSVNANSGIIICYERRYIEEVFASNRERLR